MIKMKNKITKVDIIFSIIFTIEIMCLIFTGVLYYKEGYKHTYKDVKCFDNNQNEIKEEKKKRIKEINKKYYDKRRQVQLEDRKKKIVDAVMAIPEIKKA